MRVDLQTVAPTGSRRALAYSGLLAALVVVAAGVTGKVHFAGARWVPHFKAGHTLEPPRRAPSSSSHSLTTPASHAAGKFPMVVVWIIVAVAAAGVAVLLWRWWAGRPTGKLTVRPPAAGKVAREILVEPEPEPAMPALLTGVELALQVLDEQREPADAVVRAWLGLQETAEESGIARQPAETPTEFTARILRGAFADDRAVRTLLRLYLRARFGDHPVTAEDVAAVRTALQELVRTWRTPASKSAATTR